jgi:hypothetical protein
MKTNLSALTSLTTNLSSSPATNDLRAIKPPIAIPSGWEWLWWLLGLLAVAGLLYWAWRYWQKQRALVPVVPPVPAHVRARQRLQEALALIAQPKPFCILVSDTVRYYLEERFAFRAPDRTTEEFLHELRQTNLLTDSQKTSLGEFLTRCDLVKFARHEPARPELQELHDSASQLVNETEPTAPENDALHASRITHHVQP